MQGQLWAHLLLQGGQSAQVQRSGFSAQLCSFVRQLRRVSGLRRPTFPHKDNENQTGLRPFPTPTSELPSGQYKAENDTHRDTEHSSPM